METFEKTSETEITVTKEVITEVKIDISFLNSQREQILRDQVRVASELAEIDRLIAEAGKVGVVYVKPVEVIP